MIFRLSTKLAAKLTVRPSKVLPLDPNPYADRSGHVFTAERTQFVIVTNRAALYSTVFYGRGIPSDSLVIALHRTGLEFPACVHAVAVM